MTKPTPHGALRGQRMPTETSRGSKSLSRGRLLAPVSQLCLLAFLVVAGANTAKASTVTLTFSGLGCQEPVANYYNGGLGGAGSGPGPNDGVTFSSNALAIGDTTTSCGNFINEPTPTSALVFLTGTGEVMNDPSGITTGFSFFYSDNPSLGNGAVKIYSGLNGTGTLLGTFVIDASLTPECAGVLCTWQADGVAFSGTAESVVFTAVPNDMIFNDITLGSSTPGGSGPVPSPEPSSFMLFGTGMIAIAIGSLLRKKQIC